MLKALRKFNLHFKSRKNSVIGSINTIKPSELKQPTSNLTASFAGRLAGVISYQRSGEPGADNVFFVRGITLLEPRIVLLFLLMV